MTAEAVARIVDDLKKGLAEVEQLTAAISQPATPGKSGWNARDVLAHMAFWEGEAQKNLGLIAEGRQKDIVRPANDSEIDEWNDRVFRQNQATPWPMALRYWSDLRRKNIKQIQQIDPDLLDATHGPNDRPYLETIVVDTSEHDNEHLPQLRELAGGNQE